MDLKPETLGEQGLQQAFAAGLRYDASALDEPERFIRPAFLRALILAEQAGNSPGARLIMAGLHFAEMLDLSRLGTPERHLPHIRFEGCEMPAGLEMLDSCVLSLQLAGCRMGRTGLRNLRSVFDVGVSGSVVLGELVLQNAKIGGNLTLNGSRLDGRPRPDGAEWGSPPVDIGAPYDALTCDGAQIDGDINARSSGGSRFVSFGTLRFLGVRLAGDLAISGAYAEGPRRYHAGEASDVTGYAISAERAEIDGAIFGGIDGFPLDTQGAICVSGARIRGIIDLTGADLGATQGYSFIGEGLDCEGIRLEAEYGDMLEYQDEGIASVTRWQQPRLYGALRIVGAALRSQLSVKGAIFLATPQALVADGARIDGGVFIESARARVPDGTGGSTLVLEPTRTQGVLHFVGATMGRMEVRELYLNPPEAMALHDHFPTMLNLGGARVTGDLVLGLHPDSHGAVVLENAHAGNIPSIDPNVLGAPASEVNGVRQGVLLDFDELGYDRADIATEARGAGQRDSDVMLAWLARQYVGGKPTPRSFRPQPYEQAAHMMRAKGDRYGAGRVASQKRQIRRRCVDRGLGSIGNFLFHIFFDYGYSPGRAILWGAVWVFIGFAVTEYLKSAHGLLEVDQSPTYAVEMVQPGRFQAKPVRRAAPCTVDSMAYALDAFLPLVDLGFDTRCEIARDLGFENARAFEVGRLLYAFIGLIFVPVAALTFAGVLRSD